MTSCGRHNVRKDREIKNGEKFIILDIHSKIYCLDNMGATSSEPRYYMGLTGKGLTTSLDLRGERSNNKQIHY